MTEEFQDIDTIIDSCDAFLLRFFFHRQRVDDIHCRVFRLPIFSGVGSILLQKTGNVVLEDSSDFLIEQDTQATHELDGDSASGVDIRTLHIPSHVFQTF